LNGCFLPLNSSFEGPLICPILDPIKTLFQAPQNP
jgi:hypothetical protein